MTVHLFGAASSPGCANYGVKYLACENERDFPAAASFLKNYFYVDDGLLNVKNVDASIKLVQEARVCKREITSTQVHVQEQKSFGVNSFQQTSQRS